MKKNYIAPSVETTNIQMMQVIAASIPVSSDEGSHVAEGKELDFDEDVDFDF